MKNRTIKRSLGVSILSLVLCFVMLLGTTYAWFTDSATSASNIIQTGNLDINMFWSENNEDWNDAEGENALPVFSYDNWEPGYTEVRYIKVTNEGSLAFKYEMMLSPNGEVEALAEVIDVSYDIVTGNDAFVAPTADNKQGSLTTVGTLAEIIAAGAGVAGGVLLPEDKVSEDYYSGEIVVCITMHMQESAGNEYQNMSIGSTFDILLYATQFDYESDSFGNSYDDDATWPNLFPVESTASTPIELKADGTLATYATMSSEEGDVSANLPEGVKFENGTSTANLNVNQITESAANITVGENEQTRSYDVHVEGIAADNTVPVEIVLKEILPVGLNAGNFYLYHVEDGETVTMSVLENGATPVHNSFSYDPATGDLTLYLASFSEVALKAAPSKWEGNFDYSWYNANADVYYISNADQLAAFGAIVGGMNGNARDTFAGKTVRLIANINIGDTDSENGIVFYPIGYYNNTGSYDKQMGKVTVDGEQVAVSSSVYSFKGTFDGNGYTISNFYQNTWEMFGDYNDGYSGTPNYYKDGMGLFGYVNGGTVQNLTVHNFSSDGEFTPTGVIAAYACNATFRNIAITNCNPRVYNTGNGGIVGIGGNSDDPDSYLLTFSNITIDNTNKITALWGSWDVACGGLIGMFRGAGHVNMNDCHVGAQIDVYNDVCGNYQYYWYRYAGILIGTNKNMITDEQGYTVPETEKFHAEKCTVHFGDWNDYYYCELVANSLASYTHDHQFSRLTEIKSLSEIKDGDNWIKTGNFLLIEGDTKTCYHIVKDSEGNLKQHMHEDAGYDVGIDENGDGQDDLKEDKQIVYLPFKQLFTGYGWGVKHIPIYDNAEDNVFEGVTILGRPEASSIEKFAGITYTTDVNQNNETRTYTVSPIAGREYKLSHIFDLIEEEIRVIAGAVTVTITNLDENGNVTAEFTRSPASWADGTLVFSGMGNVRITIQDYYYCTPTSVDVYVRSYPGGSDIHNFTYHHFEKDEGLDHVHEQTDFVIEETSADMIYTGKHGTYVYDFGFGPEVLDYAYKMDSKGKISYTAPADGCIVVGVASKFVGASLKYITGDLSNKTAEEIKNMSKTTLVKIRETNTLTLGYLKVTKGTTYTFVKGDEETAIYYIGYLPKFTSNNIPAHNQSYYTSTTATCTASGKTTYTCLVCGDSFQKNQAAFGHNVVVDEGYAATCTAEGRTEGKHCTHCDSTDSAVYKKQEKIDKKSHTYGNNYICTTCGYIDTANSNIKYNIVHKMDFTTGKSSDHSDLRSYFMPIGPCTYDSVNNYMTMKTTEINQASIEFTISEDMVSNGKDCIVVVVISSTNRENTSTFAMFDSNGEALKTSVSTGEKTEIEAVGVAGTTFVYKIGSAGTYRFACTELDRVGRLMTIKVATKDN